MKCHKNLALPVFVALPRPSSNWARLCTSRVPPLKPTIARDVNPLSDLEAPDVSILAPALNTLRNKPLLLSTPRPPLRFSNFSLDHLPGQRVRR